MKMMILIFFMGFIFIFILFLLNFFFSEKIIFNKNKQMSFECGIENKNSPRAPFSIQFFMICVIFILFDIEVIILLNLIFKTFNFFTFFSLVLFILIFIYLTFLMEWKMQSFSWKY